MNLACTAFSGNMKNPLALIALMVLTVVSNVHAQAASVGLTWDPSPDPRVVGYKLYQDGVAVQTNIVSTTTTASNLVAGVQYAWYVTAFDTNNIQSDPSNTLLFTPAPGVPPAPVLGSANIVELNATQWRITANILPVGTQYVATNYFVIIKQGTTMTTNAFGTNLTAIVTVPRFSPTVMTLQAANYVGLGAVSSGTSFSAPGKSSNLRVTPLGP